MKQKRNRENQVNQITTNEGIERPLFGQKKEGRSNSSQIKEIQFKSLELYNV